MAAPIVKINEVRVHRSAIVKWWLSGTILTVVDCLGDQHTKEFDSEDSALLGLKKMDNLTDIDDIDGL